MKGNRGPCPRRIHLGDWVREGFEFELSALFGAVHAGTGLGECVRPRNIPRRRDRASKMSFGCHSHGMTGMAEQGTETLSNSADSCARRRLRLAEFRQP